MSTKTAIMEDRDLQLKIDAMYSVELPNYDVSETYYCEECGFEYFVEEPCPEHS
jgi:hypothetical protein